MMIKLVFDKDNEQLGCDISKYQGKVDFFKMKKAGIKFVIIRAGYGTTEDPNFKSYIDGAIKAGLLVGVYWFMYGGTVAKAISNAKKCLEVINPYKDKIVLGVWADWEYHSDEKAGVVLSNATRSAIVRAFLNTVSENGYFTGIYSNQDYIESGKFQSDLIKDYPLWYAWYNKTYIDSYGMKGKDGYPYFWQYTSKANGPSYGVSSDDIDLNRGYFRLIDVPSTNSTVKGVTVDQFTPKKGNPDDWIKVISNLKKAMNSTFGLAFPINGIIDNVLICNLNNISLGQNNPLTDMNYVLQQIFIWWGYEITADGIFGPKTANTVKTFQRQVGIAQTMTTTPEFWKKILGK